MFSHRSMNLFLGNVSQLYTNLLMLERSIHLGKTMEKLKYPLRNLCYFTARLRHLDQHLRVHRRAKPRQYENINQSNFLLHMSTTVYSEKRKTKRSDSPPPSEFEPPWVKESEKRPVRPLLFDFKARLVFDNSDVNNANTPAASARSKTP